MGTIKKDDLEALGEMASLVGMHMAKFSSETPPDSKRKLFGVIDPRRTIAKAVQEDPLDEAMQVIPDNITPEVAASLPVPIPLQTTPAVQPTTQPAIQPVQSIQPIIQRIEQQPVVNHIEQKPRVQQLEFSFMRQPIDEYGCVQDVIKHFDNRLDDIFEEIRKINTQIKDLKQKIFTEKVD